MADADEDFDRAVDLVHDVLQRVANEQLVATVEGIVTSWTVVIESIGNDGDRNIGLITARDDRISDGLGHARFLDVILSEHLVRQKFGQRD